MRALFRWLRRLTFAALLAAAVFFAADFLLAPRPRFVVFGPNRGTDLGWRTMLSPAGRWLFVERSRRDMVKERRVYDTSTGRLVWEQPEAIDAWWDLKFNAADNLVAFERTLGEDGSRELVVIRWSFPEGKRVELLRRPDENESVWYLSRNGRFLALKYLQDDRFQFTCLDLEARFPDWKLWLPEYYPLGAWRHSGPLRVTDCGKFAFCQQRDADLLVWERGKKEPIFLEHVHQGEPAWVGDAKRWLLFRFGPNLPFVVLDPTQPGATKELKPELGLVEHGCFEARNEQGREVYFTRGAQSLKEVDLATWELIRELPVGDNKNRWFRGVGSRPLLVATSNNRGEPWHEAVARWAGVENLWAATWRGGNSLELQKRTLELVSMSTGETLYQRTAYSTGSDDRFSAGFDEAGQLALVNPAVGQDGQQRAELWDVDAMLAQRSRRIVAGIIAGTAFFGWIGWSSRRSRLHPGWA